MKKVLLLICLFTYSAGNIWAQKESKDDAVLHWQGGINASNLVGQLTGIQNPEFARTTPYDFHFRYTGQGKKFFRFDFGYETPEPEAPSGAIEEGNNKDYTVHFRMGMGWNKRFLNNWVISTGPDFIYSRQDEKTFMSDQLSNHRRTVTLGFGGASNLQYYFSKRFSLGVEMALYNSIRTRTQIFPIRPDPIDPFPFFFNDGPALQIRLYAPIELYAYYSF